jgi:ribonuclease VapC
VIVIDTSAVIAILRAETDAHHLAAILARADVCVMSSVTFMETSMVFAGRAVAPTVFGRLDSFLEAANIEIVANDRRLATAARDAFLRYGKGRHPASLTLGDCAAYALAKTRGLPLLFKARDFSQTPDFSQTDIVAAA